MRYVLCLCLAACGANLTVFPGARAAPKSPDSVELFFGTTPERETRQLTTIEAEETRVSHDQARTLADMRRAAGDFGCDALIVSVRASESYASTTHVPFAPGGITTSSTVRRYVGRCVVFD